MSINSFENLNRLANGGVFAHGISVGYIPPPIILPGEMLLENSGYILLEDGGFFELEG